MNPTSAPSPRPHRSALRNRLLTGLGAAALLASIVTFAPPAGSSPNGQPVSISPSTGPVGTSVTVTGSLDPDCYPDSSVSVALGEMGGWMPSPEGQLRQAEIGSADAVDGDYRVTGTIPASVDATGPVTPGVHEIHLYCFSPHGTFPWWFAGGTFTVTDGTTPPGHGPGGSVDLASSSVTAGGAVSFEASGFAADSEVAAELHSDPIELGVFRADSAGAVAGSVTIPAEATAGEHTFVLVGTDPEGNVLRLETGLTVLAAVVTDTPPADTPPADTATPDTPSTDATTSDRATTDRDHRPAPSSAATPATPVGGDARYTG